MGESGAGVGGFTEEGFVVGPRGCVRAAGCAEGCGVALGVGLGFSGAVGDAGVDGDAGGGVVVACP